MNYSQNTEKIFTEEKVKIGNKLGKMVESFKRDLSYICKAINPTIDDILNRIYRYRGYSHFSRFFKTI